MEGENRVETLRVLVDLALADDPVSCFSGSNAVRLLRSQTSPEELQEIGIDPDAIRLIWPEEEND
jgi:hypothetical protein